ncbi:tetratricopeptide repeat protein [Paenibacillus allorhizosphaerae]|uniref:Tetratricopeptide repeat protein n=1 Tax=Paenibacillus allorhizosphaerae TaxID=2849866 RepID=A0ABN7TT38_9BACL|nr:tetratricopeptide repeat protein [Paenibacillus allorhizosphaerae]CAG7654786.1 hypothetical protein PAECIP111802_05876 [Paenibacillus allorhizosphaerae]
MEFKKRNEEINEQYAAAIEPMCRIAWSYFKTGRSTDARRLLRNALELVASDAQQLRLKLLLLEGKILALEYVITNEDADHMFAILQEATRLAHEASDREQMANALSLLGTAHYFADLNTSVSVVDTGGKYREALDYQQQALQLRNAVGDTRGICESLFHIGTVYERWQQHEKAIEHYTESFELADRTGCLYEKTEPTRHFAYHAMMKGDLDQALHYAHRALALRQQTGFMPYEPLDHLLLCDIYLKLGKFEQAQSHAQKAYEIAEQLGYKRTIASALLSLGDILAARQQTSHAKAHFEKALRLAQELQLPMLMARSYERLERVKENGAAPNV